MVARAAPPSGAGRHASWHLVDTLASLGPLPAALPSARLRPSEADRAVAEAWLLARGIRPGEAIVLQPGAGSTVKVWPGFADLARRMRAARRPLVVLAGPADGSVVDALLTDGSLDEASLARDWPLPRIAALFALARVAVGNDSGPTHLAAAVGCPTVAVFGPTDPAVWAPIGPMSGWSLARATEPGPTSLASKRHSGLSSAETAGSAGNDPAPAGVGAGVALIEIRPPRPGDARPCAELAALVVGPDRAGPLIKAHLEQHHLIVAEAEGVVIGLCAYRTDWFQCTFVSLVVVQEKFRRRGIARELMRSVDAVSPTPRVFSSVDETNGPAIRLHGALGFAPSGHIDNLPQGTRELLFYRRVPPRRI